MVKCCQTTTGSVIPTPIHTQSTLNVYIAGNKVMPRKQDSRMHAYDEEDTTNSFSLTTA